MPTGLTLTQEQMREWMDQLTGVPPNARLRELMASAPIRTEEVRRTHDTVMYRTTHGFRVHRSDGVVQMSDIGFDASWDGHEPEDL